MGRTIPSYSFTHVYLSTCKVSNGDEGIDEESRDWDEINDVDVTTFAGSLVIR